MNITEFISYYYFLFNCIIMQDRHRMIKHSGCHQRVEATEKLKQESLRLLQSVLQHHKHREEPAKKEDYKQEEDYRGQTSCCSSLSSSSTPRLRLIHI